MIGVASRSTWVGAGLFVLLMSASCSPFEAQTDLSSVCTTVASDGELSISASWSANQEPDVNKAGGGYRIYYATSPGVDSSCSYFDVPYVSGATAPTTATVPNLKAGTYYLKVVAYSAFNPNSLPAGNLSSGSSEVSVEIK